MPLYIGPYNLGASGGGTSSGAVTSGAVGPFALTSGAVQSGNIGSGAVQGFFGATRNIASGTVGVFDFGSGAVVSGNVGSGAITGFGTSGVSTTSRNIASGSIGGNDLGNQVISSGHIQTAVIDNSKLASGAVTSGRLGVTGTPTGSKFLRDDFSWNAPSGGEALFAYGGDANPAMTLDYFKAWKVATVNTGLISNFERSVLINRSGTLKDLRVKRAFGAAIAATVTVEVNGVPTLISAVFSPGDAVSSDTVNTAAVVAGDIVEVNRASVAGQVDSYILSLGFV